MSTQVSAKTGRIEGRALLGGGAAAVDLLDRPVPEMRGRPRGATDKAPRKTKTVCKRGHTLTRGESCPQCSGIRKRKFRADLRKGPPKTKRAAICTPEPWNDMHGEMKLYLCDSVKARLKELREVGREEPV